MATRQGHTPGPWIAENIPSAGIQIKARLPFHPYVEADNATSPWKLAPDKAYGLFHMTPTAGSVSFSVNKAGEIWAMLSYEEWVQFPSADWHAMQMANARLIAAAPDLLRLLKAATQYIAKCGADHEGEYMGNTARRLLSRINDTLAAATDSPRGRRGG